jgi:hypothetical protein
MTGGRNPDGYRAIATMEKISLNSDFIKNHNCQLILIEQESISSRSSPP